MQELWNNVQNTVCWRFCGARAVSQKRKWNKLTAWSTKRPIKFKRLQHSKQLSWKSTLNWCSKQSVNSLLSLSLYLYLSPSLYISLKRKGVANSIYFSYFYSKILEPYLEYIIRPNSKKKLKIQVIQSSFLNYSNAILNWKTSIQNSLKKITAVKLDFCQLLPKVFQQQQSIMWFSQVLFLWIISWDMPNWSQKWGMGNIYWYFFWEIYQIWMRNLEKIMNLED